jgi:hypothetical protein
MKYDAGARSIEAIVRVHQFLGPGFLEAIYHRALVAERGSCR